MRQNLIIQQCPRFCRVKSGLNGYAVRLGGVAGEAMERDVQGAMERFGRVREAYVKPGEYIALCGFEEKDSADNAISHFENGGDIKVAGQSIRTLAMASDEDLMLRGMPNRMLGSDGRLREENHHIRQNEQPIMRWPLYKLERLLKEEGPRRQYYQRKNELRSTNHWGQRKLFLSELEFLTLYGHESQTVVYAGAAPGVHMAYLARLFPRHEFHLYDPADFSLEKSVGQDGNELERLHVYQRFFDNDVADEYMGKSVLFISDVRTADPSALDEEQVEDAVEEDMRLQMAWHLRMQPMRSMFKFRLPWGEGSTRYLEGDIHLPVWGRQTTTETRLVVPQSASTREYDHRRYEELMFYFNTRTRVQYYDHSVAPHVDGMCHCYDCAAEVRIVSQYLAACKTARDEPLTAEEVGEMCAANGRNCGTSSRTSLAVVVGHNQRWFEPKKYDRKSGSVYAVDRTSSEPQSTSRKPRSVQNEDIFNGRANTPTQIPLGGNRGIYTSSLATLQELCREKVYFTAFH